LSQSLVTTGTDAAAMLAQPAKRSGLSGRRRAAALLVALGPDRAAGVLKHLTDAEVKELSMEMATLRMLPPEMSRAVFDELADTVTAEEQVLLGGMDYARAVLEKSLGKSRAEELLESLEAADASRPFDFLRRTPPEQVVAFLTEESPQTIALVVASLSATMAARVLASLPGEVQSDVALRIATMSEANPDVIRELASGLRSKLANVSSELMDAGGVETLASILNHAGRSTERNVLQSIERSHADLADEIRQRLFTFDDLIILSDRDIQLILREVDQKELALALRGATEEVRNKLLANLSSRGAEIVREDMETMGPQPKAVVEESQSHIVAAVRRLEDAGQITLARGEDEEVV
jgi:flagellar motor switch protein FliG